MVTERLPYRCAKCHGQWPAYRETCAFCGSHDRIDNTEAMMNNPLPAHLPPIPYPQPVQVQRVVITDIQLSWGSAYNVAFKFFCVLAVIQFIFLGLAYALFG